MTTVSTGTWSKPTSSPSTSVDDRSFFSGEITTQNDYAAANCFNFGFSAATLLITNKGSNRLAYRFPQWRDTNKDSGIVEANQTVTIRDANKTGIDLRSETLGSATTAYVTAVG